MKTVLLLMVSNLFMTLAWYGHLKFMPGARWPMFAVILASWGVAFFEYCFQVRGGLLSQSGRKNIGVHAVQFSEVRSSWLTCIACSAT